MKKLAALLLILSLASVSSAQAQTASFDNNYWFLQLNGDVSMPTGNTGSVFNTGWGGEGSVGVQVDRDFELSLESGFDTYSYKSSVLNASWNILPVVLKGQVNLGAGSIQPYFLVAAGVAFNSKLANFGALTGSNSEADLLGETGLGLAFEFMDRSSFFVQAKVEVDNTSSNFSADMPTVFFPLSAGFKFPLN